MISFRIYGSDSRDECFSYALSSIEGAEREELSGIFEYLDEVSENFEIGVTAFGGCLLVRIYDGEYFFAYPIAVTEESDEDAALDSLRLYAIKEEIPFILTDVPSECIESLSKKYSRTELYDEEGDGERFTVRFITECAGISDGDGYTFDNGLSFELPSNKYLPEYARLCRDESVNKFWGYDFRNDADGCEDEHFLREAELGFERGCTLTLFVLKGGAFIGEALLYYFDYLGGAECAVRLLPEYSGRGLGKKTLDSLVEAARKIGLKTLYATVNSENLPSKKLFEKKFERRDDKDGNIGFLLKM